MMEPDMIFSWGSLFGEKTLGDAQGWVDKGTNIYMNSNTRPSDEAYSRTLENEYTDILNIGKIFDVQGRAQRDRPGDAGYDRERKGKDGGYGRKADDSDP